MHENHITFEEFRLRSKAEQQAPEGELIAHPDFDEFDDLTELREAAPAPHDDRLPDYFDPEYEAKQDKLYEEARAKRVFVNRGNHVDEDGFDIDDGESILDTPDYEPLPEFDLVTGDESCDESLEDYDETTY